jgi:hypothetical protein
MSPMPFGTSRRDLGEGVGGGGPLARWFLPGEHEARDLRRDCRTVSPVFTKPGPDWS